MWRPAGSSSQAPHYSPRHKCHGSLAPLLVLSSQSPLRWAFVGALFGLGRALRAPQSPPCQRADPPYQGEMSRRDKGGREEGHEVAGGVLTKAIFGIPSLVLAKSTPLGTPRRGHPSLRFLARPLPTKPASLGFCGGNKKNGGPAERLYRCANQRSVCAAKAMSSRMSER